MSFTGTAEKLNLLALTLEGTLLAPSRGHHHGPSGRHTTAFTRKKEMELLCLLRHKPALKSIRCPLLPKSRVYVGFHFLDKSCTYSGWPRGWRRPPWCGPPTTPGSRACWPRPSGRWRPAGSPVEGWVYLPGCQWELRTLCRKRPWNANQRHPQKCSTGHGAERHQLHHREGRTSQCRTGPASGLNNVAWSSFRSLVILRFMTPVSQGGFFFLSFLHLISGFHLIPCSYQLHPHQLPCLFPPPSIYPLLRHTGASRVSLGYV